jgi:serpin B
MRRVEAMLATGLLVLAIGGCRGSDSGDIPWPGLIDTDDHGGDADADGDADGDWVFDLLDGDDDPDGPPVDLEEICEEAEELEPGEQALTEANNDFGFDLMREVVDHSDGGNAYVSPLSLHVVLSMTFNGARTTTADEMRSTLRYGELSLEEINLGYQGLLGVLGDRDPAVTLALADSLWIRESYFVFPEFIDAATVHYDAELEYLDFSAPEAADTINAWVEAHTGGLIPSIIDEPINPLTMMFLINATYLDASWSYRFEVEDTTAEIFHSSTVGDVEVDTMHLVGHLPCYQDELLRAVQLPYGGGLFAMTVLLPREEATVDEVVGALDAELWDAVADDAFMGEVHLGLPRFELAFDAVSEYPDGPAKLNEVLMAMGMTEAFTQYVADFSGINDDPFLPPYISKVKHKTFVRVDEEGTESAAASMVEVAIPVDGDADGPPLFEFEVDRPFAFAISDRCSGAVLFLGKITDPPPIED